MRTFLTILFLYSLSMVYAQREHTGREEIESYKRAYLTEKLDLSPELAEKFWPVYNEFNQKRGDLRIERSKLRLDLSRSDITEKEADQILKSELALRRKDLALEEEYYDKFKSVLGSQKVVALLKAEMDFNKEILRRLRKRNGQGGQGNPH